jgi:hypothetical protein
MTERTDREQELQRQVAELRGALERIRLEGGRVCSLYEVCDHPSCQSMQASPSAPSERERSGDVLAHNLNWRKPQAGERACPTCDHVHRDFVGCKPGGAHTEQEGRSDA